MSIETKEQYLERILKQEKPKCLHCSLEMSLWEVPPINFSDGLGWGVPYLYVCFNDECPLYKEGWENLKENYAQTASYRCMCYPGTEQYECMPVFSPFGAKGQIINDEALFAEEALKAAIKKGFSILATCYVEKDWPQVMLMLLDVTEPVRVRLKAAEMMGDFGDPDAVGPMRSHRFGNEILQAKVDDSISRIHERCYTRECPGCGGIVKQRAKVCKHCRMDISGQ